MTKKNNALAEAGAHATNSEAVASYSLVKLADIQEGPNVRKTYNKAAIADLAKSIADHGLAQPILISPLGDGKYMLAAGFQRKRAFELNGAEVIPAFIRELTVDEIENVQGIENLQRVDLAPLDEAAFYVALLARGKTHADAARMGGRSVTHVKRRIGLLTLNDKVKKALAAGEITVGIAELLGRIPDVKLQAEALPAMWHEVRGGQEFDVTVGKWVKEPRRLLTEAEAARVIERRFMLDVSKAPFDPKDTELSPLGACTTCEFLTGNSLDLFGDVSSKTFCTNPADFERKVQNWLKRQADAGAKVLLTDKDLKAVWPNPDNWHHMVDKWVELDENQWLDGKNRKRHDVLTAEQRHDVVLAFAFGKFWRLMPVDTWNAALKANGLAQSFSSSSGPRTKTKEEIDREYRDRADKEFNKRVSEAMVASVSSGKGAAAKITVAEWIELVANIVVVGHGWQLDNVLPRHDGTVDKKKLGSPGGGRVGMAKTLLQKMTHGQKMAFVLDALTDGWATTNAGPEKQKMYRSAAAFVGVDVGAIGKAVDEEFKDKRAARSARDSKKKKAVKPTPPTKRAERVKKAKPPAKKRASAAPVKG